MKSRNSILHITNWYPNSLNPREALFIKEQFDSCDSLVDQQLWHVQVRHEDALFKIHHGTYSTNEYYLILSTKIQQWRIVEFLTLFLLVLLRVKLGRCRWDILNVHIAYPLLRFPKIFQRLFGKQTVITEHWSAYHRNFSLPDGSKAKQRMQRMFHHGIPVIAVSQALMKDIVHFAGTDCFPQYIVPNVVNPEIFYHRKKDRNLDKPIFLMIANWAPIKRPLLVMRAFADILQDFPEAQLRIVGYSQQWEDMRAFVSKNNLASSIDLLGSMNKLSIAKELHKASCFVHASDYETFSVVCAEALCCGVPVIASNVGGVPEFVNDSNGFLVGNTLQEWRDALGSFLQRREPWDSHEISRAAIVRFSPHEIGAKLLDVYHHCIAMK